jgi:hypothetical protein
MRLYEILNKSLAGSDGDLINIDDAFIDINTKPQYAPRKQSVINFLVPEESRNSGIGTKLLQLALDKYHDLGGQVSSLPSLKIFYKLGFRNPNIPKGNFNVHVDAFNDNWHSLYMAKNDENGVPYVK